MYNPYNFKINKTWPLLVVHKVPPSPVLKGLMSYLTHTHTHTPLCVFQDYSFQREPDEYYYAFENTAVTIPCEGIETRDDGTEQLIDVVIFKNSERINSDNPPTGLFPLSHQNHITGILLVPVTRVDSGTTYQCVIEVNGEAVLSSLQTTLYVGGEKEKEFEIQF